MTSSSETGQVTGTKDKDYNIIWFTEACLVTPYAWRPTSKTRNATATPSSPSSSARPKRRAARARAGQATAASAVEELVSCA
jgi:hypothetical protein